MSRASEVAAAATWHRRRHWSAPVFVEQMGKLHPELLGVVSWDDACRIAHREGIHVRVVRFPTAQKGRLARAGHHVFLQVSEELTRAERTAYAVHELVHFWRDDPGVPSYYGDDYSRSRSESFADTVAWMVTSPAGVVVREQIRARKEHRGQRRRELESPRPNL